jgi:hypothetical protein
MKYPSTNKQLRAEDTLDYMIDNLGAVHGVPIGIPDALFFVI